MTGCVFVDRDGTLIEDRGYVHRVEDYVRLRGAAEGLCLLAEAGFRIAIVTNQSGIGRGYYDLETFERFQAHLERDFRAQGVEFAATYFCPHRPDEGCGCRKPAPGLLERAQRELDVDLASSWVIGDRRSDLELARNAGCRAVHVRSGPDPETPDGFDGEPDLWAAARRVLRETGRAERDQLQ